MGRLRVFPAGGQKLLHIPLVIDRHHLAAQRVIRRVKRHRQRELRLHLDEPVYFIHQSAGGERNVTHSYADAVRVGHQFQKAHHIVEIVERFAHSHQDDIGNAYVVVPLGGRDLGEHFRRPEVAGKPAHTGRAEAAAHPAARLGGNADGVAVMIAHHNALDIFAVIQPEKVFYGSIIRRNQFFFNGYIVDVIIL